MRKARLINLTAWTYLWLSNLLMPVLTPTTSDADFWLEKARQLFRFGPFSSDPAQIGELLGRGIVLFPFWLAVDWYIRRADRRRQQVPQRRES